MVISIDDDFDLEKIAESGQCFRFNRSGDSYNVVAGDRFVNIKKVGPEEYELGCDEMEYDNFWKDYFDLNTSYRDIRGLIDQKSDTYLYNASQFGKGIRILRQDPWEMLISFIISQRKNIPAIKASIEKICMVAGREIVTGDGGAKIYSFPTPDELAKLSIEELGFCSLGYRDKYIHKVAADVSGGIINLEEWKKLTDDELMQELLKIFGVGVKVANCEILFGYHRLNAFPKDVWINRVLELKYPSGFDFERYEPYNGVMQQYLFFYSRNDGLGK